MYMQALDSKHRPPHHLETNRIIEVLIDGAFAEFLRIVEDRRTLLGGGFTSLSTDFVTDLVRRESFGVILTELVAEKFDLEDGRSLHMSKETAGNLSSELLSVHPKLANLEFPINLEKFSKPKTIDNVVLWIKDTIKACKLRDADFNQFTSDGASNVIGSVAEFERW
ncbi:hypothetical protein ACHAXN_000457 [Cyclotella atomus]